MPSSRVLKVPRGLRMGFSVGSRIPEPCPFPLRPHTPPGYLTNCRMEPAFPARPPPGPPGWLLSGPPRPHVPSSLLSACRGNLEGPPPLPLPGLLQVPEHTMSSSPVTFLLSPQCPALLFTGSGQTSLNLAPILCCSDEVGGTWDWHSLSPTVCRVYTKGFITQFSVNQWDPCPCEPDQTSQQTTDPEGP